MSYTPLIAGLLVFVSALFLHILLWRLLRPVKDILLLFTLFALVPVTVTALFTLLPFTRLFLITLSLTEVLGGLLCYVALCCAYIMTYPALQARCPTLRMVLLIDRAGQRGLGMAEIARLFDTADLITDRLDDLVASGLVTATETPGKKSAEGRPVYGITARGALLLRPFMLFRRFLGLAPGTG